MSLRQRLRERAAKVDVVPSDEELTLIEQYLSLLHRWNRTINLTALPLEEFPDSTLDRLIIEPLMAARLVDNRRMTWLDLGSGGGSPAIPLKIVRPLLTLTMVEARSRKAAFLREVVRALMLTDTDVLAARFEQVAETQRGTVDLVSSRAVKVDENLAKMVSKVLRGGGRLLLFQGDSASAIVSSRMQLIKETRLSHGTILRVWENW